MTIYNCEICQYTTYHYSTYTRHLKSYKHTRKVEEFNK